MAPLIISGLFWLVGILVMIGGRILYIQLNHTRHHLKEHAESVKHQDQSKSLYLGMGEKALNFTPWYAIRLFFIIVGLCIMALGFVALGFYPV
ncbi:hypothetical protein [Tuberibacillus sp. Marseille-P3662]|uniref:hypothetical protein n=1 Tax=Tuberibacillus sp. Marseille-P3662 TaxID=1965358 RepID=UPI000A1CBD1D|nr:hypothetical protein [Tuberibacillus sp. Marseille-P3662]